MSCISILLASFTLLNIVKSADGYSRSYSENYVVVGKAFTREEANDYCIDNFGTELADIGSQQQMDELRGLISDSPLVELWIGLNDIDNEGIFVWENDNTYDYTKWRVQEPSGNGNCVFLNPDGEWVNKECDDSYWLRFFACNRHSIATSDNYIYVTDKWVNHRDAKEYCDNTFGNGLATILSPSNQEEIELLISSKFESGRIVYTGLNDEGTSDIYYWNEQNNFGGYTNWACNEPSDPDVENCMVIAQMFDYKWYGSRCWVPHDFICNKPLQE